jgi:hypothetical protein
MISLQKWLPLALPVIVHFQGILHSLGGQGRHEWIDGGVAQHQMGTPSRLKLIKVESVVVIVILLLLLMFMHVQNAEARAFPCEFDNKHEWHIDWGELAMGNGIRQLALPLPSPLHTHLLVIASFRSPTAFEFVCHGLVQGQNATGTIAVGIVPLEAVQANSTKFVLGNPVQLLGECLMLWLIVGYPEVAIMSYGHSLRLVVIFVPIWSPFRHHANLSILINWHDSAVPLPNLLECQYPICLFRLIARRAKIHNLRGHFCVRGISKKIGTGPDTEPNDDLLPWHSRPRKPFCGNKYVYFQLILQKIPTFCFPFARIHPICLTS